MVNGSLVLVVGVRSSVQCPRGIAINKTTGQVYIADSCNHRVQVLNADLTFSHSIGGRGSGQGEFNILMMSPLIVKGSCMLLTLIIIVYSDSLLRVTSSHHSVPKDLSQVN